MSVLFGLIAFFALIGILYPTPWHKKIKLNNRWKNAGVFFIAAIIAGSLSSETPQTPNTVVADQEKKQEKKETPEPTEKAYKMGDAVDVSNRVFTINSVEEMDVVKDSLGTEYPAGDGARFIKINITVKNQKKAEVTIMSDEVKLLTKNGTEYSTDVSNEVWVNETGQSFFLNTLNPGVSKTANILFSVPKDVKLSDLKVKVNDGGLVENVVKYIELKK